MALSVPTVTDLENFKQETIPDDEIAGAQMHLQAATDLMELATGIHTDFNDGTLESRVLQRGILDLAWYIGTSMDDRDSQYSPFSSERIGSYSYSKAAKAISLKGETGVPFFDIAVAHLGYLADIAGSAGGITISTEWVMPELDYYRADSRHVFYNGPIPESYNSERP